MRAIILSAGQGKRLLPLTALTPKCLLPVQDELSVLDAALRAKLCDFGLTQSMEMTHISLKEGGNGGSPRYRHAVCSVGVRKTGKCCIVEVSVASWR